MKEFKLFTSRAADEIGPNDSPSLAEAKEKQKIINTCVEYVGDASEINPPTGIQYGKLGKANKSFTIDGVTVEAGEIIRYNIN